jgi:tripartite-type tricarboxylate transporter receptor subunit TctC
MVSRRGVIGSAIGATGVLASGAARAQAGGWPERPVRIIVSFAVGGAADALTRILAESLTARLGQQMLVENRPGAGGNIAVAAVARAAPDGYTLGSTAVGNLSINQFLYPTMPYDPDRDLVPVSTIWEAANLFVTSARHPARTLQDFIAWAKARPGGASFGSSGVGTTPHLCGELFCARTGITGIHVPYRESAQRFAQLISGELDFAIDNVSQYSGFLRDGLVRGLGVTSAERWPSVPEIPTMAEAGLNDFVVTAWGALVLPARTPQAIAARLAEAVRDSMADPAVRRQFANLGANPIHSTPAGLAERAQRERPMWREAVRLSGSRLE